MDHQPTARVRLRLPILLLLGAGALLHAGCNRQDTESLSRVGRKIADHARKSTGDVGTRLDLTWLGARKEPGLQEKVQERLRWENTLTEVKFEVAVRQGEVELKGKVASPLQRQRAIELVETLAGVERVVDAIEVGEEP